MLIAPAVASGQDQPLAVRVVNGTGAPLWNAEVIDRGSERRQLTNERGETFVAWNRERPLRLRVRQIGYRFTDSTLVAGQLRGDVAVFTLRRVVYTLPAQRVALRDDCEFGGDTLSRALAADALEQLRVAAERYEHLRKDAPFKVFLERRTTYFDTAGKPVNASATAEETQSDRWGERYRQGHIVENSPLGFSVPILHLQNLAEPAFWQTHCFEVTEWVTHNDQKLLRLNFWPTRTVKKVDWAGWALLDSATSELRRVEFRLVGLKDYDRPWKLQGFTTFMNPYPFIVVPESSAAVWWRVKPRNPSQPPQVVQLLRVTKLEMKERHQP